MIIYKWEKLKKYNKKISKKIRSKEINEKR